MTSSGYNPAYGSDTAVPGSIRDRRPVDAARLRRKRQDRHGRGLRTPLMPPEVPGFRTRAELFDQVVMDAVVELETRWPGKLDLIEFAVDDVPTIPANAILSSSDVVVDDGVPLARFFPPGVDARGRQTKARIVVYRRPLELRSPAPLELIDLVTDVLGEQLSAVLGDGAA
ncbi:MAG: metallopeptidase family protein [Nakamurella sp.]